MSEIRKAGSWRGHFGGLLISIFSFCLGTVFTPHVQPMIYDLKDRVLGCYVPFEQATREWENRKSSEFDQAKLLEQFSQAAGCDTPRSSQALLSIASVKCTVATTPEDFNEAYDMIHKANVMPGASFARAYNTLEYCDGRRSR